MMRAARFASQLRFDVDPAAIEAMGRMAARIEIVSQERVTDELQRIVASPAPWRGLLLLFDTGVLEYVLPELVRLAGVEAVGGHRHKDNFHHTLEVLENLVAMQGAAGMADERAEGNALWLRWAALLHDVAKPETKRFIPGTGWTFHGHDDRGARRVPRIFRRLKLPLGDGARYVESMVRLHHRPTALVDDEVTDSAVRRLLFEAGDTIDDLMMLVRADVTSKNPARVRRYLAGFDRVESKLREVEEKDHLRNFEPPVDGHEIMTTLALEPGPAVGAIKNAVEQAILDGVIPNEHDAAFDYMMSIKDEILDSVAARGRRG
jgi:poly(A) polymerase